VTTTTSTTTTSTTTTTTTTALTTTSTIATTTTSAPPSVNYNDTCVTHADCTLSFTHCLLGTCQCVAGYSYNPGTGGCVESNKILVQVDRNVLDFIFFLYRRIIAILTIVELFRLYFCCCGFRESAIIIFFISHGRCDIFIIPKYPQQLIT
jgi:hypothetical protein